MPEQTLGEQLDTYFGPTRANEILKHVVTSWLDTLSAEEKKQLQDAVELYEDELDRRARNEPR